MSGELMELLRLAELAPCSCARQHGVAATTCGSLVVTRGWLPAKMDDWLQRSKKKQNPKAEHPELKAFGDNDPVDIVEIGSASIARGAVVQVRFS